MRNGKPVREPERRAARPWDCGNRGQQHQGDIALSRAIALEDVGTVVMQCGRIRTVDAGCTTLGHAKFYGLVFGHEALVKAGACFRLTKLDVDNRYAWNGKVNNNVAMARLCCLRDTLLVAVRTCLRKKTAPCQPLAGIKCGSDVNRITN